MMVSVLLPQPFEDGYHRRGNAQWHPNNCGLVHGDIRTCWREYMGSSASGETQPGTTREPRKLKADSLTKYQGFCFSLLLALSLLHVELIPPTGKYGGDDQ
jgi:hypothetical protein